ncbi:hypothetical protein [Shewanella algae]|uniref:hypothetical protein n=1 Tax=Shewanella algae TaxID=38313 RepID=UPI001C59F729|nr:hypothetical protein [Shewanella algae]
MKGLSLAFWYKNHQSPVVFMIDDLANIYFNRTQGDVWNSGDWGGMLGSEGSMYSFLKNEILSIFPNVKFTFFLVAGKRQVQSFGSYDFVEDAGSKDFGNFLNLICSDGHEIAYHGNNHGVVDENGIFIQEWDSFDSLSEACEQIDNGLGYIQESSDVTVRGGKYCGYKSGRFGHKSVKESGFIWWFDSWDNDVTTRPYGKEKDGVFYFPSNIDCSIYSWRNFQYFRNLKYYRSMIRQLIHGSLESNLSKLLSMRGIITLQEHSSPKRTDGKIQYPNVFSDICSIKYILSYLNKYSIWWATASEVYDYIEVRSNLKITITSSNSFKFTSSTNKVEGKTVTLTVPDRTSSIYCGDIPNFPYESGGAKCIDLQVSLGAEYTVN